MNLQFQLVGGVFSTGPCFGNCMNSYFILQEVCGFGLTVHGGENLALPFGTLVSFQLCCGPGSFFAADDVSG